MEAVQGDDKALNGNGKALNGNGKALNGNGKALNGNGIKGLKCDGEVLKNTLFSKKKLTNFIAINITFNHELCTRNTVLKNSAKICITLASIFFL